MPEAITIRSSSAAAPVVAPRRRLRGLAAAILGAALLAGAGLYWTMGRESATHYVTRQISRGPIVRAVTTSGTVNPVITVQIGTYVSGVIEARYCDYNTQVKKGQICAKVDPRPYQVVVDQDRANLGVARAQLVKDQANLVYAQLAYDRNKRLAVTKAVSQDVLDASKNALDQASAQIGLDQANIALQQALLHAAEINLGYTDIISPVDGTIVTRAVEMGQTVAASFQTPTLFLVGTDLTIMQVDTNVSESDIGAIKSGDKASFTVESFPNRVFNANVTEVRQSPQTIQNVVTYDVRLGADNILDIFDGPSGDGWDVIVDGTDNFQTRYLVNDASLLKRIPVVHGSIYRFEGQVTVFYPYRGPCYRCQVPEPPPAAAAPRAVGPPFLPPSR